MMITQNQAVAKHDFFFLAASGFILGAVVGGLDISPVGALLIATLVFSLSLIGKKYPRLILIASIFFLVGNFYYGFDDYLYWSRANALRNVTAFAGQVSNDPVRRENSQTARIVNGKTKILAQLESYPILNYGDIIEITGPINPPPGDSYGRYLIKERIHGIASYPNIEIVGHRKNRFFGALSQARQRIKGEINHLFNQRQTAFLTGVLLGDREEFSADFLDKLSTSGTLHLTALSGLHITIIIFIVLAVLSALWKKRGWPILALTFLIIALFVALTGFTVSALRAALMALVVGLAKETGREHNPRNAIALAALILVLSNPKVPFFDLGFQLSFAATSAIIYLTPIFKRWSFFASAGFLHWREILVITMAAQLGVAPLTITTFGNFSFSALPANIAILVVMTPLMFFGLATVAMALIFAPLAGLLSQLTAFLLDYVIFVINLFAAAKLPFNPNLGSVVIISYYAILIWLSFRYSPQTSQT